jgi:alpha-L-rhamnosidase
MKKIILSGGLLLLTTIAIAQFAIDNTQCENLANPVGLDLPHPRLSWQLTSDKRNCLQAAYEITVSDQSTFSNKSLTWNSGKVTSPQSVHISYQGPA